MKKIRVDQLLVTKHIAQDIHQAQKLILAGKITTMSSKVHSPAELYSIDTTFYSSLKIKKYVSRGGEKLAYALKQFQIIVSDLICIDIGSSTGGFTDCLLQSKAKLVYAVDSGTNQLSYSLRKNSHVKVMENYNFRYAKPIHFNPKPQFACIDVSFISLTKIFPALKEVLVENSYVIALLKPQFEAKRKLVDGGVVDLDHHPKIIEYIKANAQTNNFTYFKIIKSPILGNKKKNIEYLMLLKYQPII